MHKKQGFALPSRTLAGKRLTSIQRDQGNGGNTGRKTTKFGRKQPPCRASRPRVAAAGGAPGGRSHAGPCRRHLSPTSNKDTGSLHVARVPAMSFNPAGINSIPCLATKETIHG